MTNPVWQPGPPQEPGWFWVEFSPHQSNRNVLFLRFYQFQNGAFSVEVPTKWISRHAGPVTIPEPIEPESN